MIFRTAILVLLVAVYAQSMAAEQSGVDRRLLEQALDGTQKEIERARRQVEESSQQDTLGPSLLLAEQALDLVRGMSLNESGTPDPRQLLEFLDQAEARIDSLRGRLSDASNDASVLQQLELSEQRIEQARQALMARHYSSRSAAAPALDPGAMYARAQRQLDEARIRARELPNSEVLLSQLDQAQARLDAARAGMRGLPVDGRAND